MLETVELETILGAVSGVAATVGVVVRYLSQQRELSGGKLMEMRHRVYETLHAFRDESHADRVSMVKLSDDGGMPVVGEDWHATVFAEVTASHFPSRVRIEDTFDGEPIDEYATDVIQEVCKKQKVFIEVDDMPPGSLLRTLYDAFGIYGVGKYFLFDERGALWLIVASYCSESNYRAAKIEDETFFKQMGVLRVMLRKHRWLRERARLRG